MEFVQASKTMLQKFVKFVIVKTETGRSVSTAIASFAVPTLLTSLAANTAHQIAHPSELVNHVTFVLFKDVIGGANKYSASGKLSTRIPMRSSPK